MELLRALALARDLTDQLHCILADQDPEAGRGLLEQRARAMAEFDRVHREASPQEREQCRVEIAELADADGQLQDLSRSLLAVVAAEFREQLGLPNSGIKAAGKDPLQACVDRKA